MTIMTDFDSAEQGVPVGIHIQSIHQSQEEIVLEQPPKPATVSFDHVNAAEKLKDILIEKGFIDCNGDLCKKIEGFDVPYLDLNKELEEFLDEKHTIEGMNLSFTLRQVFCYLSQYNSTECRDVHLIGGYVLHLMGARFFVRCLKKLGLEDVEQFIDPRFLYKLEKDPSDTDIRYYVPGYSHSQLRNWSHLFIWFLTYQLNPNHTHPSFHETYKFVLSCGLEKKAHPYLPEKKLHFLINAIRDSQKTEMMFVDVLPRYHLFTCNALYISVVASLYRSNTPQFVVSDLDSSWTAILHQMMLIIDADDLETIDNMGYPMYISYLMRGYVCLKPDLESHLATQCVDYYLSEDKIASQQIILDCKKVMENHHKDDPQAILAYVYQLLFISKRHLSDEQFCQLRILVSKCLEVSSGDTFKSILTDLIIDSSVPFEIISSLLTIYGSTIEGGGKSTTRVLTRDHCKKKILQVHFNELGDKHQFITDSDCTSAVEVISTSLPTIDAEVFLKIQRFGELLFEGCDLELNLLEDSGKMFKRNWAFSLAKLPKRKFAKEALRLYETLEGESDPVEFCRLLTHHHYDLACRLASQYIQGENALYETSIEMVLMLVNNLLQRQELRSEIYIEEVSALFINVLEQAVFKDYLPQDILIGLLEMGNRLCEVHQSLDQYDSLHQHLCLSAALMNRYRHLVDHKKFAPLWLHYFSKALPTSIDYAHEFWRLVEMTDVPSLLSDNPLFSKLLLQYVVVSDRNKNIDHLVDFLEHIKLKHLSNKEAKSFELLRGKYLSFMIDHELTDQLRAFVIEHNITSKNSTNDQVCVVIQFSEELRNTKVIQKSQVTHFSKLLKNRTRQTELYLRECSDILFDKLLLQSNGQQAWALSQIFRLLKSPHVLKLYSSPTDFLLEKNFTVLTRICSSKNKSGYTQGIRFAQEFFEKILLHHDESSSQILVEKNLLEILKLLDLASSTKMSIDPFFVRSLSSNGNQIIKELVLLGFTDLTIQYVQILDSLCPKHSYSTDAYHEVVKLLDQKLSASEDPTTLETASSVLSKMKKSLISPEIEEELHHMFTLLISQQLSAPVNLDCAHQWIKRYHSFFSIDEDLLLSWGITFLANKCFDKAVEVHHLLSLKTVASRDFSLGLIEELIICDDYVSASRCLLLLPDELNAHERSQVSFEKVFSHYVEQDHHQESLTIQLGLLAKFTTQKHQDHWLSLITEIANSKYRPLKFDVWQAFNDVILKRDLFESDPPNKAACYFQVVRCVASSSPDVCRSVMNDEDSLFADVFKGYLSDEQGIELFTLLSTTIFKSIKMPLSKDDEGQINRIISHRASFDEETCTSWELLDSFDASLIEWCVASKKIGIYKNLWICFLNMMRREELNISDKKCYSLYHRLVQHLSDHKAQNIYEVMKIFDHCTIQLLNKNPSFIKLDVVLKAINSVNHSSTYYHTLNIIEYIIDESKDPVEVAKQAVQPLYTLLQKMVRHESFGAAYVLDQKRIRAILPRKQYESILESLFQTSLSSCLQPHEDLARHCQATLGVFMSKIHLLSGSDKQYLCVREFFTTVFKLLENPEKRHLVALSLRCYFQNMALSSLKTKSLKEVPIHWKSGNVSFDDPSTILPTELPPQVNDIRAKNFHSNYSYYLVLLVKTALESKTDSENVAQFILDLSQQALNTLIKHYPELCLDSDGQEVLGLFFNSEYPMCSIELLKKYKLQCNDLFIQGHKWGIFKDSTLTISVLTYISPEATAQFSMKPTFYKDIRKILDKLLKINTTASLYQALHILKPNAKILFDTRAEERLDFFKRLTKQLEKNPFLNEKGTSVFEMLSQILFPGSFILGTGQDKKNQNCNQHIASQVIASALNVCTDYSIASDYVNMKKFLINLPNLFMRVYRNDLFLSTVNLQNTMEVWGTLMQSYFIEMGDLNLVSNHIKLLTMTFQTGICEHQIEYQGVVTHTVKFLIEAIQETKVVGYEECLIDLQSFFSKDSITIDQYEDEKIIESFQQ
jgi:hypothetical protein